MLRLSTPASRVGLAVMVFLLLQTPLSAAPGITERVSVDSAGNQANSRSLGHAISADGRFVAFESDASNLVPGDDNNRTDVFVHDRQTAAVTIVSASTLGIQGNDASHYPAISADGRFIVFESDSINLVPGDTNGAADIFVRDRDPDADGVFDEIGAVATTRLSVSSSGSQANGPSLLTPAISADGRFVAFMSFASNLVPSDTNSRHDFFVHDRDADGDGLFDEPGAIATDRVNVSTTGQQANGVGALGFAPNISADGRFAAFMDEATNLVSGDTNVCPNFTSPPGRCPDIFVHDRQTRTTTRVSVSSSGEQGNNISSGVPSLSGDGSFIAFSSSASNLVDNDTNGKGDVFIHDLNTGTTTRVSVNTAGQQANDGSGIKSITADGRYVAFGSRADNLVPSDTNLRDDIFLKDRQTGITTRISVASSGAEGNGDSIIPSISDSGGLITFISESSNLVPGDSNTCFSQTIPGTCEDIFLHQLSDADSDGDWDPFDPGDADIDGFSDRVETYVGTNPLLVCGVDAWPPDINNDTFVDVIGDISAVTSRFGQSVPPAPARYDVAPDPPDGFIDVISDISRLAGLFGSGCN